VIGGEFRAHVDEVVLAHMELGHETLRLDQSLGEVTALGVAGVLGLLKSRTQLQGDITVALLGSLSRHLAAFEAQHGDRRMGAGLIEEAGHSQLFGDDAGSHRTALPTA